MRNVSKKTIGNIAERLDALEPDKRRILSKEEIDAYLDSLTPEDLDRIEADDSGIIPGWHMRRVLEAIDKVRAVGKERNP